MFYVRLVSRSAARIPKNKVEFPYDSKQTESLLGFQKLGTAHGEELAYFFGAPLVDGFSHFPANYTKTEVALSESVIIYLSNFVRSG